MMKPLKFLLTNQLKSPQSSRKAGGFTLIELLVGMIMAFLIITPILGFVINVMETDRREQAKASSEQEIQAALDYIARDVEQAVYIYDATGLNNPTPTGIQGQLPTVANGVPVLVFWKREFLPKVVPIAGTCPTGPDCDDTFVYALVAYYLITDPTASCATSTWSCTSRVSRIQVRGGAINPNNPTNADGTPRYIADLTPDPGFKLFSFDQSGTLETKMNTWTKDTTVAYNLTLTPVNTLIDYVDQSPPVGLTPASCSTAPRQGDATLTPYTNRQVPSVSPTSSFYACVDVDTTTAQVFIRGNALARINPKTNPPTYDPSRSIYFPTASIQVRGRGFLNGE